MMLVLLSMCLSTNALRAKKDNIFIFIIIIAEKVQDKERKKKCMIMTNIHDKLYSVHW